MVAAHVTDSWTRESDRLDDRYFAVVFVNGLAAPLFLLLAGVALAMAAEGRARSAGTAKDTPPRPVRAAGAPSVTPPRPVRAAAARSVLRRGWQVFGLALLFRVQAQILGWGPAINLLKVDILNVMGLAMVAAAWLWRAAGTRTARVWLYAGAMLFFTMLTPPVRTAVWLDSLPDPLEWYVRPDPGRSSFALFPWAGFLMAGALVGELIDAAKSHERARRVHGTLALAAGAGIIGGSAASSLPSIYDEATFWSSSPTFFFIRLGLVLLLVPLAWYVGLSWSPLVLMGRSSLFVYWIHVEMVYGSFVAPIKRTLALEGALLATAALSVGLYGLVRLKYRWLERRGLPRPLRFLAPVLR